MATSWKGANKFRLITIICLSLLTSAASVDIENVSLGTMFYMLVQAGIAGFAFLQCPGDRRDSG